MCFSEVGERDLCYSSVNIANEVLDIRYPCALNSNLKCGFEKKMMPAFIASSWRCSSQVSAFLVSMSKSCLICLSTANSDEFGMEALVLMKVTTFSSM